MRKNHDHMTEFGELVPSMFLWQSEEERKKTARKLETITDKKNENSKKQIPPS